MKKEDIPFLEQMIKSLEDGAAKLDSASRKQNYDEFRKTKKFMLDIQKKIANMIK